MFGEKILEYWDDIERDLGIMVSIPSVAGEKDGELPFGKDCAKALDTAIEMAEGYGLKSKNVDYYAMHAEYGEGEENTVVMAHLDVVPAGEGWETDPYEMVKKDGKLYGRGTGDNKGPAIIALHCLRALKDANVEGKRKLRVVLGSSEEVGMEDMKYYFSKEQAPTMGFTPDAEYGICNCEKGLFNYNITSKNDSTVVRSFASGTVPNAVPYSAKAELACSDEEYEALTKAAEEAEGEFTLTKTDGGAQIYSQGKASHASTPEMGFNAATHLVKLLCSVFGDKMGKFFTYINDKIGTVTDGSLMGVAMSDEESGELTFNLGVVACDAESLSLTVDIRYPATKKGADVDATLSKVAAEYGLTYTLKSDAAPLYVPADSKLIKNLKSAYEDATGSVCKIFSMGGGTYARQMKGNGVAFGADFPGRTGGFAHMANEYIEIEKMKLHAQICLEAMYRLFTAE